MSIRTALALGVLGLAVGLYVSGAYQLLEPWSVQRWIQEAGPWGWILFIVAHAGLQPLGFRSIFFLLSAPLIWTPFEAVMLSWAGAVLASILSFGIARFIAREWVQRRAPARFRAFDDRLYSEGFRTVAMLRLVFYTTPALQYALGVSRVRFAPFLAGTVVGVAPFTLLVTLFGAQLGELVSGALW